MIPLFLAVYRSRIQVASINKVNVTCIKVESNPNQAYRWYCSFNLSYKNQNVSWASARFRFRSRYSTSGWSPTIYPVFQSAGALKPHRPSCRQNHILTCCRVSASAIFFVPHMKFSKPRYHDNLTGFEGALDDLQEGFNDIGGFSEGIAVYGLDRRNDVRFGECAGHKTSFKRGLRVGDTDSIPARVRIVNPFPEKLSKPARVSCAISILATVARK